MCDRGRKGGQKSLLPSTPKASSQPPPQGGKKRPSEEGKINIDRKGERSLSDLSIRDGDGGPAAGGASAKCAGGGAAPTEALLGARGILVVRHSSSGALQR